jgi:hypothetical protein
VFYEKAVNGPFKIHTLLDFVDEQVGPFIFTEFSLEVPVQRSVIKQFLVFNFVKVDKNDLPLSDSGGPEVVDIQRQEGGFSASPYPGDNFDKMFFPPPDELIQIFFSLYRFFHCRIIIIHQRGNVKFFLNREKTFLNRYFFLLTEKILFFRGGPAGGLFPAVEALGLEPFFPDGPGRFGGAAVFGEPGRRGDKGLQPGICPFPVDSLGSFPVGTDDDFIVGGDTAGKGVPEPGRFRLVEPRKIPDTEPQQDLGVNLVDILTAGPAGPGKTYFPLFVDGTAKLGGIHYDGGPEGD